MKLDEKGWGGLLPHVVEGDLILGKKYVPIARKCAMWLFDRFFPGQISKAEWFNLDDGTRIWVVVQDDDLFGKRAFARIYTTTAEEQLLTSTIYFENGLLIVEKSEESWRLLYPFDVAVGSRLSTYFGGSGLPLSCSPTTNVIVQGEMDVETCPPFSGEDLPSTSTYISQVYNGATGLLSSQFTAEYKGESAQYTQSAKYTGLMRLAVQSLLASGLHPADIFPFAVPSFGDGLHLDSSYNPWVVRFESDRVLFWKMLLDPLGEQLRTGLIGNTLEDPTWSLALMFSRMTGGDGDDPVIYEYDVNSITENCTPVAHSWKHSRFTHQASMVVVGADEILGEPVFSSKRVTMDITLPETEEDSPEVSGSATGWDYFQIFPGVFNLVAPTGTTSTSYYFKHSDPLADYSVTDGNVALIYGIYDEDDVFQTVSFECGNPRTYIVNDVITEGSKWSCGAGGASYRQSVVLPGATAELYGAGFNVPGFVFESSIAGSVTTNDSRFTTGYAAAPSFSSYDYPGTGADRWYSDTQQSLLCNGTAASLYPVRLLSCDGVCTSDVGAAYDDFINSNTPSGGASYRKAYGKTQEATASRTVETAYNRIFNQIVVLPYSDAEAMFVVGMVGATSYSKTGREWNKPTSPYSADPYVYCEARMEICRGVTGTAPNQVCSNPVEYVGPTGIAFSYQDSNYGDSNGQNWIVYDPTTGGSTVSTNTPPTDGELITSTGRYGLSAYYANWQNYIWAGLGSVPPSTVDAFSSYNGDVLFYDGQLEGQKIETGYTVSEIGPFARWIGNS